MPPLPRQEFGAARVPLAPGPKVRPPSKASECLVVLLDRSNRAQHVPWIVATLAVTAISCAWYLAANAGRPEWLGGGSLPGFTFGVIGGLICLFEFLLWPRKKYRT